MTGTVQAVAHKFRPCPKDGGQAMIRDMHGHNYGAVSCVGVWHMHLQCLRCGYQWVETKKGV